MAKKKEPELTIKKLSRYEEKEIPAGVRVWVAGDRVTYEHIPTKKRIAAVEFSNVRGKLGDILAKWASDCEVDAEKERRCPPPKPPEQEDPYAERETETEADPTVTVNTASISEVDALEIRKNEISKMSINDLRKRCVKEGLGCTGNETKPQLVAKILGAKVTVTQ